MDSLVCVKNGVGGTNEPWGQGMSFTSKGRTIAILAYKKTAESGESLEIQRKQSTVQFDNDIPLARLVKADFWQYTQLSPGSHQSDDERITWLLANVLFNDDLEDDISARVPKHVRGTYLRVIKKDRLSRLWSGLIREKHAHDVGKFGSLEERSVLLLCSHRIDESCKALVQSGNLHLASLVAQIGRDPTTRADMKKQIEAWRQYNVYSEMTEPIRALYELLAGNALVSQGKSGGALEDRVSTFSFTERFELDWFQAFGLRLWYGITDDEPIETAVSKFVADLAGGSELAFPRSAYLAGGEAVPVDSLGRESPLWVLLKVYAATVGGVKDAASTLEFPAALLPESVSGDVLTNRLSFQLYQTLVSTVGQYDSFKISTVQADHLTHDYAWELAANGLLEQSLFVLLHLSEAPDREWAVKGMLSRFAPKLPSPAEVSTGTTWQYLTRDLRIPEEWIWVAKALYARDTGDASGEVDCLIRGKNWDDAHATFCRIVGPSAVIERDYDTLKALLSGFGNEPEKKVRGWASGGGVYEDFVLVATTEPKDRARLNRLVNALVSIGDKINHQKHGVEGLEERVAFQEMSNAVVAWTLHDSEVSFDISLQGRRYRS